MKNNKEEIQECLHYLKEHMAKNEDVEQVMKYINRIEKDYQEFMVNFDELKSTVDQLQEGKCKRLLSHAISAVDERVNHLKQQMSKLRTETSSYLKWQVHCCKNKIAVKTVDMLGLKSKLKSFHTSLEKVSNAVAGFTCQFGKVVSDTRRTKQSIRTLVGMKVKKEDHIKMNQIQKLMTGLSIYILKMQSNTENVLRKFDNLQRQSVKVDLQKALKQNKQLVHKNILKDVQERV